MKIKYMHTIEGKPAQYFEGEQICYAHKIRPIKLADSLAQIRKEQRATIAWRKKFGFSDSAGKYSHFRISI